MVCLHVSTIICTYTCTKQLAGERRWGNNYRNDGEGNISSEEERFREGIRIAKENFRELNQRITQIEESLIATQERFREEVPEEACHVRGKQDNLERVGEEVPEEACPVRGTDKDVNNQTEQTLNLKNDLPVMTNAQKIMRQPDPVDTEDRSGWRPSCRPVTLMYEKNDGHDMEATTEGSSEQELTVVTGRKAVTNRHMDAWVQQQHWLTVASGSAWRVGWQQKLATSREHDLADAKEQNLAGANEKESAVES